MLWPMTDAATRSMELLDDPARWDRADSIPVFDAHTEVGQDGISKRVFDRALLEEIAEACNRRAEKTGDATPITLGHTRKEASESQQPPIIGYARNYRVAPFGPDRKLGILADFFVRKDKGGRRLLDDFPRRSVELWGKDRIFDGIALLRRTPQRDLGLTLYGKPRDGLVRYSVEDFSVPDEPMTPAAGDAADLGEGKKNEGMLRHIFSHPYAKECVAKYAMPPDGAEAGPADNPPEEVTPYSAPAFAAPSATNAGEPEQFQRPGRPAAAPSPAAREAAESVQYARLRADMQKLASEVAEVKKTNLSLREQNQQYARQTAEAEAKGYLTELANMRVIVKDPAREFERMVALSGEGRKARFEEMAEFYARSDEPVGEFMVPTRREPAAGAAPDLERDPESIPPEDLRACQKYERDNKLWDLPLHEVAARALPHKYSRAANVAANGTAAK